MHRSLRNLVCVGLIGGLMAGCASEPTVFNARVSVLSQPIWMLRIDHDGTGQTSHIGQSRTDFKVTEAQIEAVKRVVENEKAFELAAQYGKVTEGIPTRTIFLTLGDKQKDIRLDGPLPKTDPKYAEIERAMRVWKAVSDLNAEKAFKWDRAEEQEN